ncbi:MAG: hypothetical protein H0X33_02725 [Taibaiella sp.]|nr:hypothetical protein [Taibaiella sp.]
MPVKLILKILTFSILAFFEGCHHTEKYNENFVCWRDASTNSVKKILLNDESKMQNGIFTTFYFNGNRFSNGKKKDGKYGDTINYYDINGNLELLKIIKNDTILTYFLEDGNRMTYYQDGKICSKGVVKNHYPGGIWKDYSDDGKILSESNIIYSDNTHSDTGFIVYYYQNGNKEEKRIGNFTMRYMPNRENSSIINLTWDINNGTTVNYYFQNGNPKDSTYLFNNNGFFYEWFETGKIKTKGLIKNRKLDGNQLFYKEDGQIEEQEIFINGKLISSVKF